MSKSAQGKPVLLAYQEITDPSYASVASAFEIEEHQLGTLSLRGPCPRCGTVIEIPVVSQVVRRIRRPTREPAVVVADVEPVICTCDEPHEGRPEGRVGCGAYWNFTL
jgi:hypothetical protein